VSTSSEVINKASRINATCSNAACSAWRFTPIFQHPPRVPVVHQRSAPGQRA
jgi:hypothetical protein